MSGQYPGQQPFPASHSVPSYPEQSQAMTVLVLGLLGMILIPLLAPFAWVMGNRELQAIDAGRRPPKDRQMAQIGRILGIVMSVFLILFVVLIFGLVLLSLVSA